MNDELRKTLNKVKTLGAERKRNDPFVCWIDKEGRIHNEGNHLEIAGTLFPKSDNPELSCERAGYIKIGRMYNGSPLMENCSENDTQAQKNACEEVWEKYR